MFERKNLWLFLNQGVAGCCVGSLYVPHNVALSKGFRLLQPHVIVLLCYSWQTRAAFQFLFFSNFVSAVNILQANLNFSAFYRHLAGAVARLCGPAGGGARAQ